MNPRISAFDGPPDDGSGQARDMRVRWALEEVNQPYDVRLVSMKAMKQPEYLALHPFGQIPTYEEGDLVLFETGAIILRIAETHSGLLPVNVDARARAITWLFAALNTVEPPIVEFEGVMMREKDESWFEKRLPAVQDRVRDRLSRLSTHLGHANWLDGAFSVGDLMMVEVLLRIEGNGLVEEYPNLAAYVERGKQRPAFRRAFAAQAERFKRNKSKQ